MQWPRSAFGLIDANADQRNRERNNKRHPAQGGRVAMLEIQCHKKRSAYFERISVCLRAVGVSSTFRQPETTLVSAVSDTHTGISSLSVR